jgi:hypothetical protein
VRYKLRGCEIQAEEMRKTERLREELRRRNTR